MDNSERIPEPRIWNASFGAHQTHTPRPPNDPLLELIAASGERAERRALSWKRRAAEPLPEPPEWDHPGFRAARIALCETPLRRLPILIGIVMLVLIVFSGGLGFFFYPPVFLLIAAAWTVAAHSALMRPDARMFDAAAAPGFGQAVVSALQADYIRLRRFFEYPALVPAIYGSLLAISAIVASRHSGLEYLFKRLMMVAIALGTAFAGTLTLPAILRVAALAYLAKVRRGSATLSVLVWFVIVWFFSFSIIGLLQKEDLETASVIAVIVISIATALGTAARARLRNAAAFYGDALAIRIAEAGGGAQ